MVTQVFLNDCEFRYSEYLQEYYKWYTNQWINNNILNGTLRTNIHIMFLPEEIKELNNIYLQLIRK